MGLDQYLIRRIRGDEDDEQELFYWRKFNALQAWMYGHYAGGDDHQQLLELDLEGMRGLRAILQGIVTKAAELGVSLDMDVDKLDDSLPQELADHCSKVFPTQAGFFFGGTGYDGRYLGEVGRCLENIKQLIEKWKPEDKYYYSSWW